MVAERERARKDVPVWAGFETARLHRPARVDERLFDTPGERTVRRFRQPIWPATPARYRPPPMGRHARRTGLESLAPARLASAGAADDPSAFNVAFFGSSIAYSMSTRCRNGRRVALTVTH